MLRAFLQTFHSGDRAVLLLKTNPGAADDARESLRLPCAARPDRPPASNCARKDGTMPPLPRSTFVETAMFRCTAERAGAIRCSKPCVRASPAGWPPATPGPWNISIPPATESSVGGLPRFASAIAFITRA